MIPHAIKESTIWQMLYTLAVENSVVPLTLIALTVLPSVYAVTLRLIFFVLSYVFAAVHIYAFSLALPFTLKEVSLVVVAIWPHHLANTMWNTSFDLTFILDAAVKQQSRQTLNCLLGTHIYKLKFFFN